MKNPKQRGAQEESMLIKKYADQWCKDNGYPIQKKYYVYREKVPIPKREGRNR